MSKFHLTENGFFQFEDGDFQGLEHLQPDELGGGRVPHPLPDLLGRQSLSQNDERKVRKGMQNLRKV